MKQSNWLVLLFLLALVAAACSPAATPTSVPPTTAPTSAPPAAATATRAPQATATSAPAAEVKLSLICRCVAGGVNANTVKWLTENVIPKFQDQMKKQGKNITVNLVQFGGSDEEQKQQYALDLKAGRGSDVIAFDGFWVSEFVEAGLLKPLDEVGGADVNSWEGWSHIPKGIQDLLSTKGKRYGIPIGTDVRVLWYRKDILKAAGLPDNWQPKSWDELLDAARKVKQARPDVTPLQINAGTSMGEATTLQGWYMVVLGAGANVYNFDTGKYIVRGQPILEALNFYKKIYRDEKLGDDRLQLLKDGRDRSFIAFRDGKIAMLAEGDFLWRSVLAAGDTKLENRDQLVGWVKMPAMAPGKGIRKQDFVTASGGGGYTLNPNTKNPKEAWALLSYMSSKEAIDDIQKIQPRIQARDDVSVPNDPVMTALAKEVLPFTTVRPTDADYSKTVSPAIQVMTERVVSGEMSPQQAIDAYAKTVTDAVGANRVEEFK